MNDFSCGQPIFEFGLSVSPEAHEPHKNIKKLGETIILRFEMVIK